MGRLGVGWKVNEVEIKVRKNRRRETDMDLKKTEIRANAKK